MVLAVAALLVQIQAVPQGVFTASSKYTVREFGAAATTAPADTKDGKKASDSNPHPDLDSASADKNSSEKGSSEKPTLSALNTPSFAETQKQAFSTIRIPDAQQRKPVPFTPAQTFPSRKSWLVLSLVQSGAATFDAYSTRRAIGNGAREDDPTMRPFAHSPAIYAAIQGGPLVLDYLARRMQRSERGVFRHTWWVPQSISTAGFILAGIHNVGVSERH